MSKGLARLGDTSDHDGSIISASGNAVANGIKTVIQGDMHSCPIPGHGVTALTASDSSIKISGTPVIQKGDRAGCGATITSTSTNVM